MEYALRQSFKQQIITLSSAAGLAQAITFLFSPVLTHLYTPEDFGVFSIFTTTSAFLALLWTMRYELAIPLQRRRVHSLTLIASTIDLAITFSLLLLLLLSLVPLAPISEQLGIAPHFLFLLPLSAFLYSIVQLFERLASREHNIKLIAKSKLTRSATTALFSILLAWLGGLGLIAAAISGLLLSSATLARNELKSVFKIAKHTTRHRAVALFKRHKQFPQYDLPSSLLYFFSSQGFILLLVFCFDPIIAGYYALAERLIASPISIFTNSYSTVFYVRLTEKYNNKKTSINDDIKQNTALFLSYSILPFLLALYALEYILGYIFGPTWNELYLYILALSPALFVTIIAAPSSTVLRIIGRQDISFKLHLAHLTIKIGVLAITALYLQASPLVCLVWVSLASFLIISTNILIIFKMIGITSYKMLFLMLCFIVVIIVMQYSHGIIT